MFLLTILLLKKLFIILYKKVYCIIYILIKFIIQMREADNQRCWLPPQGMVNKELF